MSEGRYEDALTCLTAAISKNPIRHAYFLKRAECLYELNDYQAALGDLGKTDDKAAGSLLAARCYARMGAVEPCITQLEMHLRSPYKEAESAILLDPAFAALENQHQWKELWRKEWYDDEERLLADASFLVKKKDYLDVLELLSQEHEAVATNDELLAVRAEAFFGLGNLNNCINDLSAAIARNGSIPGYYNRRAEAYDKQGKYPKAIEDYSRSLLLNEDQFTVYYARAQAYKAIHELDKAGEDMGFLVRYFPRNEKYLYETGRIFYMNKQYVDALKQFNSLLQLSADSAKYFQARGEIYLSTGIYRYAANDFSMALDLDPLNSECYLKKGLARYKLGDTKGACTDWEKASRYGSAEAGSLLTRYCK
jgi:tetratricopeptide (TPR) repeat protein